MTTYKVIGQPATRADGPQKVSGEAKYTADIELPGMLFGKSLRSPYPHARVLQVDTSKAKSLPGVHVVLTGADLKGYVQGRQVRDMPLLAQDIVRFAGEKVAVVAAEDEDIALQALDLIEVEYEELTPLLDPLQAMEPSAPLLHPDMLDYKGYLRPAEKPSNVFFQRSYGIGDPDVGMEEADHVFEATYTTSRTHQGFLEPRASVVWAKPNERVQVWATNKAPHGLKQALSAAIGLTPDDIVVNPTFVGGDFGAKAPPMDEPLCYFLSLQTGRPVKMVMDYMEEFMAGNPRHESVIHVKTGVKYDGTITAHLQEFIFNTGGYAGMMPLGFLAGVDRIAGNLRIPHARFDVNHVYSNNVPGGYMRGPGEVQGTFAIESHMDEIARKLEMDPLEFRRKNILRDGDRTPMDELFMDVRAQETLEAAIAASDYDKPKPANVGRGIAMCSRPGGPGETHVIITLEPGGSVLLQTPIFEQGSGTYTMLGQVASEILGISPDQIHVEPMDTDGVPFDSGVAGSRTTRMAIPAVYDAAKEALTGLLKLTSDVTGWPLDTLTSEDGQVRRQDTKESTPWSDVLSRAPNTVVSGRGHSKQEGQPEYTGFCAQVAEVHVDPDTGQVTVLGLVSAHDVGTIFSPVGHQGQINGAVIMGLGYTLMEDLKVEDGRVTTLSFGDVKLPNIGDIPPLKTVLVTSEGGTGPYKAKAIGEAPIMSVAPAIANAVRDATGIRPHHLPLTAEEMHHELRERGS
jgi:CO/xanthine dehydrogenase Mo-binding subunit